MNKNYTLRYATMKDIDLIYKWANDSTVRDNSFSSNKIAYDEHVSWYKRLLKRNDAKQYILCIDGVDVGQARITVVDSCAEIGYSVASEHRGKGYGKLIVSLLPQIVERDFPMVTKLIAQVKVGNVVSQKAFLSNGFDKKCIVYEKILN